ncbi:RNB domain-containing ribonuclease [Salinibacterium soli]|uniref:RNB domain-containing ribonuclease n=1 Tax=Antiquaquibacter soli TaxID=3064523 RepID=UPI00272C56DE|nr:RNB domain-containing ribonuclease [Protaetiibacter sp. WY-16]
MLAATLRQIRDELGLPESFPAEVQAEARESVAAHELPGADRTGIPFVTIDPPGATDLDQALHLERAGDGYTVHYAIADVPAFVPPLGAVDTEARERGQTLYAPDGRIPLHPTVISEDAASLLPGAERGAFVWTFALDARGETTSVGLERARIRSRRQFSYAEVQSAIDDGEAGESLQLLREVGMLRLDLERERGGASLNRPDEEIEFEGGRYWLVRRAPLPVETWNAQISLLTGMAAARIMIDGGVGILRTMPEPLPDTIAMFRRQVAALGCPWPEGMPYGEFLRGLDHSTPSGLAAVHAAASLFRGAGYTAFDGEPPENPVQAAVAAPYAHTTAPLRRLVDRFVLLTCESLVGGRDVPAWVREALPTLPKLMGRSNGLASRLERASVEAIEAALLEPRVGEVFDAVVISAREGGGTIQLADPVVTAAVEGDLGAGDTVRVRLAAADIPTGVVEFVLV